jgi:hypothetical protein
VVGNDDGKSAEIVVMADKSGAYSPFGSHVPHGTCGSLKLETDQGSGMKDRNVQVSPVRGRDGTHVTTADRRKWVSKRPPEASVKGIIRTNDGRKVGA